MRNGIRNEKNLKLGQSNCDNYKHDPQTQSHHDQPHMNSNRMHNGMRGMHNGHKRKHRGRGRGGGKGRGKGRQFRKSGMKLNLEHLVELSEDLLRFILEQDENGVKIKSLLDICVNSKVLGRIIDLLENDGHIIIQDEKICLTVEGKRNAEILLQKHLAIEKAFQSESDNLSTHKMAHILEHMLSVKEITQLCEYSSSSDMTCYPLDEYPLPEAHVYKLNIKSEQLFYKLLSLGIYPSQRIEIENRNGTNQVIKVKESRFAIDILIAKQIFVVP